MNAIQFVNKLDDLPSLSVVAEQINRAEQKKSLNSKFLSDIIRQDPALAAKILKLSNSSYYGQAKQVKTIERAVTILGFNAVKSLALSISVYNLIKSLKGGGFDFEGLWHHSLGCAVAAKILAIGCQSNVAIVENAFLAGILHDIGLFAIAFKLPNEMAQMMQLAKDMEWSLAEVEQEILGFTHPKVGGLLAEKWNFPEEYVIAVKHHHLNYLPAAVRDNHQYNNLIHCVAVGNLLVKAINIGKSLEPGNGKIPPSLWNNLGLERRDLPAIREKILASYNMLQASWGGLVIKPGQ
ncbi:MAG: HDOD domain-containing protein [Desulfobulbaceae bacterium]|nr:HDOD domain-containing protein [Desulfobulbaceae bacterium]